MNYEGWLQEFPGGYTRQKGVWALIRLAATRSLRSGARGPRAPLRRLRVAANPLEARNSALRSEDSASRA